MSTPQAFVDIAAMICSTILLIAFFRPELLVSDPPPRCTHKEKDDTTIEEG